LELLLHAVVVLQPVCMCEGKALPLFDVSVPHEIDLITLIAVFFSLLPYVGAFLGVVLTLHQKLLRGVLGLLLASLLLLINEALLKQLLQQPRPPSSCLSSPGMPSSHSVLSIGVATWFMMLTLSSTGARGNSVTSSSNHHLQRQRHFLTSCFLWASASLPVPLSRVTLGDHTIPQVVVGSAWGFILAILYFALVSRIMLRNQVAVSRWCDSMRLKNDWREISQEEEIVLLLGEEKDTFV